MMGFTDPLLPLMNGLTDRATTFWTFTPPFVAPVISFGKFWSADDGCLLIDGGYITYDKPILPPETGTCLFWITWNGGDVELIAQRQAKEKDTRKSLFCLAIKDKSFTINGLPVAKAEEFEDRRLLVCLSYSPESHRLIVDGKLIYEADLGLKIDGETTRIGYSYKPVGLSLKLDHIAVWNEVLINQLVQRISSIGHF